MEGHSFRQFYPSKDASPRQGVILCFINGTECYRIAGSAGTATVTLHCNAPRSVQELPAPGTDCIRTESVSISIRNMFDDEKIAFRRNDPENVLPLPFPVFASWTQFVAREYIE